MLKVLIQLNAKRNRWCYGSIRKHQYVIKTTLQSQNYQDADDAKRTAYSKAVNAAATILIKQLAVTQPKVGVERQCKLLSQPILH